MEFKKVLSLNKFTPPALAQWKSEQLYLDNDDYYRDLISDLDGAQFSIDMEVFTFEDGVLAQRLLAAFQRAIQRGVMVRLICDGWGSPLFWSTVAPQLKKLGVRFRVYRPLPWRAGHTRGESRLWLLKLWIRFKRINRGFHRKVTLIDRKIAWVGSLNVSDLHLKEVYGKNAWADVGARLEGDAIKTLQLAFEKAFYRRKLFRLLPRVNHPLVLLNDSFIRRRRTTFIQKRRLRRAHTRIWIQNPYFVPERSLLRSLYKACRRGIDVRVIIPEKNDQPIVKWMTHALMDQLLHHGIKVYEFQNHFTHKKILIVDQIYTIGSTNFNHRSFLHDQEVEVLITNQDNQKKLEQAFEDDLKESIQLTIETLEQLPWYYRAFTRIMFFLRYWS